jgi:hypothetical protein
MYLWMDVVVVNAIAECKRSTMDWCYDVLRDVIPESLDTPVKKVAGPVELLISSRLSFVSYEGQMVD